MSKDKLAKGDSSKAESSKEKHKEESSSRKSISMSKDRIESDSNPLHSTGTLLAFNLVFCFYVLVFLSSSSSCLFLLISILLRSLASFHFSHAGEQQVIVLESIVVGGPFFLGTFATFHFVFHFIIVVVILCDSLRSSPHS
jgi:hypothetical protein